MEENPSNRRGTPPQTQIYTTQQPKRKRVDVVTAGLMIITALIFDALQFILDFIPLLGWVISSLVGVFAWLTFFTWTAIRGWKISSVQKKFVNDVILPFVDLVPIVNALPMQTIKIVRLILLIRAEDAVYNTTHGKLDLEKVSRVGKAA